jgi:hypothetical protein
MRNKPANTTQPAFKLRSASFYEMKRMWKAMIIQHAPTAGDMRSPMRLAFQHNVYNPPESRAKIVGYRLLISVVEQMKSSSTTSMLGKSKSADCKHTPNRVIIRG